jgi:hypothetical protein
LSASAKQHKGGAWCPATFEEVFILLKFGKKENTGGVILPVQDQERKRIMTSIAPPAPPAPTNPAKNMPEMHVNIFAHMGQDSERVKQTIQEMQENFGREYNICFHINFNQPRKQVHGDEKRRETGI